MDTPNLMCARCCQKVSPNVKEIHYENIYGKQFHLAAYCPICKRFIKNLPHSNYQQPQDALKIVGGK